jgi:hypothetical protein
MDGAREGKEVRLRTCGYECLGSRLACKMGEREGRANPFKRAEVPEDHRRLTGPETEDGLVGLAPLLVEQSRAGRRVRARRALNQVMGKTVCQTNTRKADIHIQILLLSERGPA